MLFLDAKIYMPDDILMKVDRASMAVALEVRAPFLDLNVVELLAALPLCYKLHGLTTKYVLKRAVQKILPSEIINRNKKGFEIPVAKWLREGLRELVEDMLAPDRIQLAGIFRPEYIRQLLDDHYAYRRDNHKYLWSLLMFELWYEHYH
jgi:asparagine synthase (glutamine-hydrolysing)